MVTRTHSAIGAVTNYIRTELNRSTVIPVYANHPKSVLEFMTTDQDSSDEAIGIFLYEAAIDGSMRDAPFPETEPAPLWLVLKYLVTAFDTRSSHKPANNQPGQPANTYDVIYMNGGANTINAHETMGRALAALQSMSFLQLPSPPQTSLQDNPEELKITFDEVGPDLVSKLFQSTDMDYCFSMGFQVRPVYIVPNQPPRDQYLVGIDYNVGVIRASGSVNIPIELFPVMYPVITGVNPPILKVNVFEIMGENLNLQNLSLYLGGVQVTGIETSLNKIGADLANLAAPISAGPHSLQIIQTLPGGKTRRSAPFTVRIPPRITPNTIAIQNKELIIDGEYLGVSSDDISAAIYEGPDPLKIWYEVEVTSAQTQLKITIQANDLPVYNAAKTYTLVLRVNGEYALSKPGVTW